MQMSRQCNPFRVFRLQLRCALCVTRTHLRVFGGSFRLGELRVGFQVIVFIDRTAEKAKMRASASVCLSVRLCFAQTQAANV